MIAIRIVSRGSASPFKLDDLVLIDPSVNPCPGDFVVFEREGALRCTSWGPGLPELLGTVIAIVNEYHLRAHCASVVAAKTRLTGAQSTVSV